jgi:hypothetical protein
MNPSKRLRELVLRASTRAYHRQQPFTIILQLRSCLTLFRVPNYVAGYAYTDSTPIE